MQPSHLRVAHAHLTKLAAKRRNPRALKRAVEKVVDQIRNLLAGDPDFEPGGRYYDDPVADVQIWTGSQAGGADLVLAYDGAGYDWFSLNAEYPRTADRWREKLFEAAERLGYHAEDRNNWSMGFYFDG
jgi:hypothetical protein